MNRIYVLLREFIYGLDTTEFGDDGKVITYDSRVEAEASLEEYVQDVNHAYEEGMMDSPYEKDVQVALVEKVGNLFYNSENGEYYRTSRHP